MAEERRGRQRAVRDLKHEKSLIPCCSFDLEGPREKEGGRPLGEERALAGSQPARKQRLKTYIHKEPDSATSCISLEDPSQRLQTGAQLSYRFDFRLMTS